MNDHFMEGSERYDDGFIDSGTTFTYFPTNLFKILKQHFEDWFCPYSDDNCLGRTLSQNNDRVICFHYDEQEYPEGPYKFFASYPVMKLKMKNTEG